MIIIPFPTMHMPSTLIYNNQSNLPILAVFPEADCLLWLSEPLPSPQRFSCNENVGVERPAPNLLFIRRRVHKAANITTNTVPQMRPNG